MFDVWQNVLAEIEQNLPRASFVTWFTDVNLLSVENGVATIGTPNVFKTKQLESKYSDLILRALNSNDVSVQNVYYVVQSASKPRVRPREVSINESGVPNGDTGMGGLLTGARSATRKIPDTKPKRTTNTFQTGLNPKYRLDNFVIGSNNDLAVSVAKGVVDKPGEKYNPFFLYGGSGLGKTHLIQAIGNELLERNQKLKILYTPISHFYSEFINAIKSNRGEDFANKFRKLDVLIIDDFQLIVGKDRSQEEFFNIFNDLYQLNKQIIVTSDRLPSQIKSVDERLASRLTWAGAIDLQLPNFEDKCAILKSKTEFMGVEIEDEAIEFLAENVKTNIRDLESELNRLLAVADLKNTTPLAIISEGYVNTSRGGQMKSLTAKQVVEKVAKFYGLSVKELCSKSRVANIKNARQVAMFMLSEELSMSTPKIALEVGVKDHTTVMHGIKRIRGDLKLNFGLREEISAIREKLYG